MSAIGLALKIRPANTTDAFVKTALIAMHDDCFGDEVDIPELDQGWWWLAWLWDSPVGFCCMRKAATTPGAVYFARAGVLPRARGNGLQRRLIRVREARARAEGFVRIVTDTTENVPSSNNLIACGYRLFEPQERWAFKHSLYWQKTL